MAIIVSAPAEIKLNGKLIGTTKGDITITLNREYIPVKRQDSPHPFKYVKKNIYFEIEIPVSEHSGKNLARLFDIPEEEFELMIYDNKIVQDLGKLEILAGGNQYVWENVVSIGTRGISYSHEDVVIIPLVLRAILKKEEEEVTAKLHDTDLPAQFTYKIRKIKRSFSVETYSGFQRFSANVPYDTFIDWVCENMTIIEKAILEDLYEYDISLIFQGIHGEKYSVYFESMEAPEEEDGYWRTSGVFRVIEKKEEEGGEGGEGE